MDKKEVYDTSPNGIDQVVGENLMNSEEVYAIPNEEACSAEFSEGCVIAEEQAD